MSAMHYVAAAVQLVGTIVTGLGLVNAQLRVTSGVGLGTRLKGMGTRLKGIGTRLSKWLAGLLRKPGRDAVIRPTGIPSGEAFGTYAVTAEAAGEADFHLRDDLTPDEKFAALADRARGLESILRKTNNDITVLRIEMSEVSTTASQETEQAIDDMRSYVHTLHEQVDYAHKLIQKLDLKWAIYGLAITALGMVLSFFGT
jgi:hypothetical protein